ncbi:hypothetical protein BC831DRAFT_547798 [Entophlyctis helioformis]|nr:hypothetical protein BC831DRAFT_547798 [Entophlyctis helioformis]
MATSPVANVDYLAHVDIPAKRPEDIKCDSKTYRDLVMFEERLRQNMKRIKATTFRWKAFLVLLLAVLVVSGYWTLQTPSSAPPLRSPPLNPLPQSQPEHQQHQQPEHQQHQQQPYQPQEQGQEQDALVHRLFFASGMFRQKLLNPAKFAAQCNRSLKPYNMVFHETTGQIGFARRVPKVFQDGMAEYRDSFMRRRVQSAARRRAAGKPAPAASS